MPIYFHLQCSVFVSFVVGSTMFLSSVSVITVLIFIIFYKSANRRLEAEQRAAAESLMSGEWMGNSSVSS